MIQCLETFPTRRTWQFTLGIGVRKRVAEVHHAASIAAVGKSNRMSQLVYDLFDDPGEESPRICASMQVMQTDQQRDRLPGPRYRTQS
jgi:hypothetical protein